MVSRYDNETNLLLPRLQQVRIGTTNQASDMRCYTVQGVQSRWNRLLHLPSASPVMGNVVFFPGDVQDEKNIMVQQESRWSAYSFEATAALLSSKFPGHHIWVIAPATKLRGTFSCYSNFCSDADSYRSGAVSHYPAEGHACEHLLALLTAAAQRVAVDTGVLLDMLLPLTLVGFSKGAVVLNQLVSELGACCDDSEVEEGGALVSAKSFIASFLPTRFVPESFMVAWEQRRKRQRWASSSSSADVTAADNSCSSIVFDHSGSSCSSSDCGVTAEQAAAEQERWLRKRRKLRAAYVAGFTSPHAVSFDCSSSSASSDDCTDTESGARRSSLKRSASSSSDSSSKCNNNSRSSTAVESSSCSSSYAHKLFSRIKAIHWVDAGNGPLAGSLPTNSAALKQLAAQYSSVQLYVHGTPYQWASAARPLLKRERDVFSSALPRTVVKQYFADEKPSLDMHFRVLEAFDTGLDQQQQQQLNK
jgi:Uncharacterised protein family UPF0565